MIASSYSTQCRRIYRGFNRLKCTFSTINERKGFGSFHSDDIEELIRQDDSTYKVPDLYIHVSNQTSKKLTDNISSISHSHTSLSSSAYGTGCRHSLYNLDEQWKFLNHGAFGLTIDHLLYESNLWRYICESQPLRFFDRELLPLIAFNVRNMAKLLHCPPQELVPLTNVTTGINAAVNSIKLGKGDVVMCYSLTYGSTKKILTDLCNRTGAVLRIVHIPLPIKSSEFVIKETRNAMCSKTKLVIIDHITSNTAVEMPIDVLGMIAKSAGAAVVIDAAHTLFTKDIAIYPNTDPSSSGTASISTYADYWISNTHKWLCNSKGCAFMWVSPARLAHTRPCIISHGYEAGNVSDGTHTYASQFKLLSSFAWDGCRDYAALLTTTSAINTWNSDSGDNVLCKYKVRSYMNDLLKDAVSVMYREWSLNSDDVVCPLNMKQNLPMTLVPLPAMIASTKVGEYTDKDAFQLQELLHHQHMVEVPIKCLEGRLYVRLSAHIYNDIDEYVRFAKIIRSMIKL